MSWVRLPVLLVAAAALSLSSGCDYTAVVTPVSSAAGDVRIRVSGPGGLAGKTAAVGSIFVYRGPSRQAVWIASIPAEKRPYPVLTEIRYGVLPPGFVEEKRPEPLAPGDEISFEVLGPGIRGEARIVVAPGG